MTLFLVESCQAEIVEYEQINFGKGGEQLYVAAVSFGKSQVLKQT